jgi:hypothetical protein
LRPRKRTAKSGIGNPPVFAVNRFTNSFWLVRHRERHAQKILTAEGEKNVHRHRLVYSEIEECVLVLAPAHEYLKFEHQVGRPLPHLVLTEIGLIDLESGIDELFNDLSGLRDYLGFVFVRTDVGEIEVFIMPDEAIAPGKTEQHTITDKQIDSELRLKKVRKRFSCLKKGSFLTLAPFVEGENFGAPLADR